MNLSGLFVAAANSVIEIEDVLLAKMQDSGADFWASWNN